MKNIILLLSLMISLVTIIGCNEENASTLENSSDFKNETTTWTEVTPSADFSGRRNHASVVFDNKLWVIGGSDWSTNDDDQDEVWYSSDGITWTQATDSADFGQIIGHTSVVFDNKLWVIGGYADSDRTNAVWYSSDGITWTQATPNAGFSPRNSHASVVFDNKLWVIGGSETGNTLKNDVWYSPDGVTWTQATAHAAFGARYGHTVVAFDNELWVIAGEENNSLKKSDVWHSTDGAIWTRARSDADFGQRMNHTSVVYDSKMWVLMGWDGDQYQNDAWSSIDGITWTRETSAIRPSLGGKGEHSSVVFEDSITIIAGADESAPGTNDVWQSN